MKLTFAHMGHLYIPIGALFRHLGLEVVLPPPSSKRTLSLGCQNSPEFACLPLKVNVGNYIEAIERGADTIVMAGGIGPCRFGFYGEVEREILQGLGYEFTMFIIDPPQGKIGPLLKQLGSLVGPVKPRDVIYALRLCWEKVTGIDRLNRLAVKVRPREVTRGETTRTMTDILAEVDRAETIDATRAAVNRGLSRLAGIPQRQDGPPPPRVGLVGEIYVVLEPFVNLEVETRLGELGCEVERSIYLSDWIRRHVIGDIFRILRPDPLLSLARPYLGHFVGGHGLDTVAHTVEYARRGFDGVIQVMPFTCMPEIVAESILPRVSKELGIPVMTLVFDEHSSDVGVITRLEAFTDLIMQRRVRLGEIGECAVTSV
ncbi:MAG TPA: CoA protein activase [Firmicutes bacterium]|nr:CoA protein activase [Bacillota bacterium]